MVFGYELKSLPGSVSSSRGPSRATSPAPGGKSSKLDSIRIEGNLYDVLNPRASTNGETFDLRKEMHVMLKYTVSFTLSKPVYALSLKAEFIGMMNVTIEEGDGQFQEPESVEEEITRLSWVLWRGTALQAGVEHTFEINGELPPKTPRSLRAPRGRIDHTLTVRLDGVTDSGKMRRTRKTIEVWNPFSMDADDPRPGLEFHGELDEEMVGQSVALDKDLYAFIRYPDQCFKGIGRSFPIEISLPTATSSQLNSISNITIDLYQIVWFLRPTKQKVKPELLAKDEYPITTTATVQPSNQVQRAELPLPDPLIHGRFTSDRLRVRHSIQVTFHRKWFAKKVIWDGDVEIFHRDVGWEARGVQGIMEIVRGQEGDYWPAVDGREHKPLT